MFDKKQYLSNYYILNKNHITEQRKAYYIQNKDKLLNYNKIYRQKKCINIKEWYNNNIEQRRKKCRDYYERNKQKFHEYYMINQSKFSKYYKTKNELVHSRNQLLENNNPCLLYF